MTCLLLSNLKKVILILLWVEYIWEQYLRVRQYKKIQQTENLPKDLENVMSKKSFEKSKLYNLQQKRFAFLKDLVSILMATTIIVYGILAQIWDQIKISYDENEIIESYIWYVIVISVNTVINWPLTLYEIFNLEVKNSSKFTPLILSKKIKKFFWSQLSVITLSFLLINIIQQGDKFFINFLVINCGLIFIIGIIYPRLSPSSYCTLSILKPGNLRSNIENLADHLNFPLTEIYIEENFRRHFGHVYQFGFFKKNIVISKILISSNETYSDDEILALILVKLSAWYYKHSLKYLIVLQMNLLLSFFGFFLLFKSPEVYEVFGFVENRPILVGIYIVLKYMMSFYNGILSVCFMYISRQFVWQNDNFAVKYGKNLELASALIKLEKIDVKFPVNDSLYSVWHYSKPSLLDRVTYLKNVKCCKTN